MAIAGHVSREMLEHYSHVRLEAKRRAVEALSQRHLARSYVTRHDTTGGNDTSGEFSTETKEWSALADDFRTFLLGVDSLELAISAT